MVYLLIPQLMTKRGLWSDEAPAVSNLHLELVSPSEIQVPRGKGKGRLIQLIRSEINSMHFSQLSRNLKWFAYYDEYRSTDDLLDISTDEEQNKPTIHHAFDNMFSDVDSFPFMVGGASTPITHIHPSTIQIFQLWQVYLNNVNPLLKIFHAPILQVQVVEAGANLASIAKPLEALMFSIYFIAVESMTEEEVQRMFGEVKPVVLNRYRHASEQALVNAEFMKSNNVMVLQAFLLYLVRRSLLPI